MTNRTKKDRLVLLPVGGRVLIHYTMRFVSINSNGTFNTVHTADIARYALLGRMKGLSKLINHYASILLSVSFYIVSHCSSYQFIIHSRETPLAYTLRDARIFPCLKKQFLLHYH
jgi:hypothetical protein